MSALARHCIKLLLLAAVIVFTVYSAKMYSSSRAHFTADQRPYLVVDDYTLHSLNGFKLMAAPSAGEGFAVQVVFRNAGQTPALKVTFHCHVVCDVTKIKPEPLDEQDTKSQPIPQGGWVTRNAVYAKDPSSEDRAALPSTIVYKSGTVYAFGRVTYYDTAGNLYCTPYMKTLIAPGEWAFVPGIRNQSGQTTVRLSDLCAGMAP
jgi:hypothetical protein